MKPSEHSTYQVFAFTHMSPAATSCVLALLALAHGPGGNSIYAQTARQKPLKNTNSVGRMLAEQATHDMTKRSRQLLVRISRGAGAQYSVLGAMHPKSAPTIIGQLEALQLPAMLKLSDTKQEALADFLADYRKDLRQLLVYDTAESPEVMKRRYETRIRTILSADQLRRVEMAHLRWTVLVAGIDVTLAQAQHLRPDTIRDLRVKYGDKSTTAVKNTTAMILKELDDVLTRLQAERLKKLLPDMSLFSHLPLEIRIWQLSDKPPRFLDRDNPFTVLHVGARLRLNGLGVLREETGSVPSSPELAVFNNQAADFDLLREQDNEYQKRLERYEQTLNKRMNAIHRRMFGGQLTFSQAAKEVDALKLDLEDYKWKVLEDILLPHQIIELKRLVLRRAILQQGIIKATLYNPLLKILELSREQRDALQDLRVRARKQLVSISRDLEHELIAELRSRLPEPQSASLVSVKEIDRSGTLPGAPQLFLSPRRWVGLTPSSE